MAIHYEWDVEEIDEHGDVVDHDHSYKLEPLLARYAPLDAMHALVLVQNEGNDLDGITDRNWAYVLDQGVLPDHFLDSRGVPQGRIPVRFKQELEREIAKVGKLRADT